LTLSGFIAKSAFNLLRCRDMTFTQTRNGDKG
jgi:hypothetical protein